ncbi:MAG: methyltransferase, partial [Oscillospiraceae bacterium]|nr:methyltransferase [Oscillospiraceae bacterium]
MMHDDWGNQKNMFFSPEMWRKFFKEPERRMVKRCQELGMHYMHHSCGYIEPIIPDLVEIGVESWHGGAPVNDLKKIKAEYGDKLIFAGGVDPQVTDTGHATEEEIRAEVRRVIDTLGKGGGLMISSAVMFSTVPNVDILVDDETAKYGRYDTLKFD